VRKVKVGHLSQNNRYKLTRCELARHTQGKAPNILSDSGAGLIKSRYVLDIGQSQDWLALQVSMAPCLIGYGVIGQRLHADPKTKREGNIYWKWIENYAGEDFTEAVRIGSGKKRLT
jgi:hypothetical protein